MVEEFVDGTELSVQAVARDGAAEILTLCEKLTTTEHDGPLYSFREAGHVAYPGAEVDARVRGFVDACVAAVGYANGPFHVDLIRGADGALDLLEMGFRLSGMGITELIERTTGRDWGDDALGAHLGERRAPVTAAPRPYTGQATLRHADELAAAESLPSTGGLRVEIQYLRPPTLPADWSAGVPESLRADVTRHAAALARVVIAAPDPTRVTRALETCLTTSAPVPV
ncbi:ATP-grasp domain-containing protein [Actinoplanes sp. NPDC051851]|uniref:ATP-grasp domain-containing protein n=1 Tax=Actinoplanes sp. NPDC051851 TaxID=3154753 RepID=UPI003443E437